MSKKGAWDTTKAKDGVYEVQVRVQSALDLKVFSAPTWDKVSGTKGSLKVVVDNTPPKLTQFGVSGKGSSLSNMAKIGDTIQLKLQFDQPMRKGPLLKLDAGNSTWSQALAFFGTPSWALTKSLVDGKMTDDTQLTAQFKLPEVPTQTRAPIKVQASQGQGLGAFIHLKGPNQPDTMNPTSSYVSGSKKDMLLYADLERPTGTISRVGNVLKVSCRDKVSGLQKCIVSTGKNANVTIPSLQNTECSSKRVLLHDGLSTPLPRSCLGKKLTLSLEVKDCAGNTGTPIKKTLSDEPSVYTVDIPATPCPPVDKGNVCFANVFQQTCSPKDSCELQTSSSTRILRSNIPSCEKPDENVDLSTYQGDITKLKNVDKDAPTAVLHTAYAHHTIKLLGSFGLKAALVHRNFSPSIYKKHPTLIIPSAGLLGQSNNATLKAAIDAYVKQGGKLLVFSQAWGKEYTLLPQSPKAVGFNEDVSCFWASSVLHQLHPTLVSLSKATANAPLDGYFTKLPTNATILLNRRNNGLPVLASYPHGKGHVVLTSFYTDWAHYWSQDAADGRATIRDTITWLQQPDAIPTKPNLTRYKQTLSFTHTGTLAAQQIRIRVLTPDRDRHIYHKQIKRDTKPGNTVTFDVDYTLTGPPGMYHTEVTLLTNKGTVVFGPTELPKGRVALIKLLQAQLYTDGIRINIETPARLHSTRSTSLPTTISITNKLPSVGFTHPRTLHVYIQNNNTKHTVTLGQNKTWTTSYTHKFTNTGQTQVPIRVVVFDKDAPLGLLRPVWTNTFKDTDSWPFAKATSKVVSLAAPKPGIFAKTDKTHYKAGATVTLDVELREPRPIHYPCRVDASAQRHTSAPFWTKQWTTQCTGTLTKLSPTSFRIPTLAKGTIQTHVRVYDLSGNTPALIAHETQAVFLAVPQLTTKAVIPRSIDATNPIVIQVTNTGSVEATNVIVNAQLRDQSGKIVKLDSKTLGNMAKRESQNASLTMLPSAVGLGVYTLHYQVTSEGQSWAGKQTIPSRLELLFRPPQTPGTSSNQGVLNIVDFLGPRTPAILLGETFQASLILRNTGHCCNRWRGCSLGVCTAKDDGFVSSREWAEHDVSCIFSVCTGDAGPV